MAEPRAGSRSLARRLARTLILWAGGVWLACTLAVGQFVNLEIRRNFDAELAETAHRLFAATLQDHLQEGAAGTQPQTAAAPLFPDDEPVVLQLVELVDGAAVLRVRTASAPAVRFDVPQQAGFARTPGWRVYTARHPSAPYLLHVADPSRERRVARNRALYGLLVPMGAALLLLAGVLARVARRELAVLHAVELQIGQRGGGDLRPLALDGLPTELVSVGEHVNHLLARLAQALDVERALAANAAHELRTPLAAVRLRLQTALDHGLQRSDVQAALDAVLTLSRRTEKLLELSRAESSAAQSAGPVDLHQLAHWVAQEFAQAPVPVRVCPSAHGAVPCRAIGDLDALAIALRNLVENAVRYGGGSPVDVEVAAPATLVVRDAGPGVPADRLSGLRERHVRHSADRAGYGLGLSIAASVVAHQGGRLELLSPPPGYPNGFEARLVLAAGCS